MISKKRLIKMNILILTIVFSFSVILIFDNPIYHVMAFWLVAIIAIILVKFEVSHPYFWFSISFGLYSTAYAILYILGYISVDGYNKNNIFIPFFSLSVVLLTIGTKINNRQNFHITKKQYFLNKNDNKKLIEIILMILLLILIISIVPIIITPVSSKNDLLSTNNIFFTIGIYSTRFLSFFACFYLLLFIDIDRKKTKMFILLAGILIIYFSLLTGDRDAMLRYLVIIFITLYILGKIKKRTMLALVPLGMIFLTSTVYFKYFFAGGGLNENIEDNSFIYNFLTSDFSAAGQNLQVLLNNSWTKSMHDYSLIITDILSPFLPGGIFMNVGVWFNETFYANSYSRAFTLVGEGYVIAGLFGVLIIFLILSIGIKLLYYKSIHNIYWLLIYIYSIPTVILAFRSTLGTIFSDLTRIAIFGLFVHGLLLLIINNKKK